MVEQQHLDILKQGVNAWNHWRQEHPDILPDLSGAQLEGADLGGAQLKGARLFRAQLAGANLIAAHLAGANLIAAHLEEANLSRAYLEGANLNGAHLGKVILREAQMTGANLSGAHLEKAILIAAQLTGANLSGAHLEKANLKLARLKGANFIATYLTGTILFGAHLAGAVLTEAHLEGADLREAHLAGANLSRAYLEGANLSGAHLEGTNLSDAHLEEVTLQLAFFDNATKLDRVNLGDEKHWSASLVDISWSGVNLAVVDWAPLKMLGDEQRARQAKKHNGEKKYTSIRLDEYRTAVRANRQLAVVLRDQGLNEEADHFAYRAQLLQHVVWRRQRNWFKYTFSGFLYLIAGYGYQAWKSVIAYLLIIVGFAVGYYFLGQREHVLLSCWGSLVYSVMSFHGRGFFPGTSVQNLSLDDLIIRLAAFEAVIGLFIEICFIATFTQRYFAR